MRVALVDFQSSFYDRHWVYSLIPVLQRHRCEAKWFNLSKPHKVASFAPDLVLYSAFDTNLAEAATFDRELKKLHRCKSLLGGPGPTFDQQAHLGTTIDAICIGEGEAGLDEFLASGMTAGRNLVFQDGKPPRLAPLIHLDEQPLPDRDWLYKAEPVLRLSTFKAFMSGRGCPFQCTYCFNHAYNKIFKDCGPMVRKKSVDYLLEEISHVRKHYPLQLVSFQDDTFIIDKKWVFEFCEKFPRVIGVPFVCNLRPNLVTEDVVAALKAGGCTVVGWAIESGNERIRNKVLCRNVTQEQIQLTAHLLRKYGIRHVTASITGVPTETREELEETIEANLAARSHFALANIFVPYPGLRLTEFAIESGQYDKTSGLPRHFYAGSVLKFSEEHKQFLRKTAYLMWLFAHLPWAYRNRATRAILYGLPACLLHAVYECAYLISMKLIYRIRMPLRLSTMMAFRHLRRLFK